MDIIQILERFPTQESRTARLEAARWFSSYRIERRRCGVGPEHEDAVAAGPRVMNRRNAVGVSVPTRQ